MLAHYLILFSKMFGKYLEPVTTERTYKICVVKSTVPQKCWTAVKFKHFIMIFLD